MRLEPLEPRNAPSWLGPILTYSFVPDGTRWLGGTSYVSRLPSNARQRIADAIRLWGTALGYVVAEVPDNGAELGAYGKEQGDLRFGDIRIGAAPDAMNVLASSYFPPPTNTTYSGDVSFNADQDWSKWDLYAVAIHELGHGIAGLDHSDDPNSVMQPTYTGLTTPSARDVDEALSRIGERWADPLTVFNKVGSSR